VSKKVLALKFGFELGSSGDKTELLSAKIPKNSQHFKTEQPGLI
jgi:hypothetical protein